MWKLLFKAQYCNLY